MLGHTVRVPREHGQRAGVWLMRRWVAPLVAGVAVVMMGVSVVAWQDAERAAEEAEAAADEASAVEGPAAAARIAILEGLLQPKSLYPFLDVYDAVSSAVCTDQQTPIEALVEEEVAAASEEGEPLSEYEGWELAFEVDAAQASRYGCSNGG